ncbi:MAG: hypothetical protein U0Q20_08330 [Mycobacterium sp.]|nr:hypothetical protein [Mycobacterium sp.]
MTHSHFRRIVFIATMAVGTSVLGPPAAAIAAPDGEWDVAAYDECMKKTARSPEGCCITTGGVITNDGGCVAPPAAAQGATGQQGAVEGTPPVPATPPQDSAGQQGAVEATTTTLPMPPRQVFQLPQSGAVG